MDSLEPQQEPEVPDGDGTETEDLPSDFFDEFNKEEFIEGLSIIDSWVDGIPDSERVLKSSKDSQSARNPADSSSASDNKSTPQKAAQPSRSPSSQLDEFIKPGSRRDPSKTNEAIKKDKEVKLKEYLAKSLESSDDLRPPGTELDGYFDDPKPLKKDKTPAKEKAIDTVLEPRSRKDIDTVLEPQSRKDIDTFPEPRARKDIETLSGPRSRSRERRHRDSPVRSSHRLQDSPLKTSFRQRQWSPRRSPRRSSPMRRSPARRSPYRRPGTSITHPWQPFYPQNKPGYQRRQWSPNRNRSPRRYSPRRSPRKSPRRSPRKSPRRSPRRSPRKSPRRSRRSRSRSPYKRSRHSRSRSPLQKKNDDRFLYPTDTDLSPNFGLRPRSAPYVPPGQFPAPGPGQFPAPGPGEFPGGPSYPYGSGYSYGSNSSYEYGGQPLPDPTTVIPGPGPSPGPMPHSLPLPHIPMPPNPVPAPIMVPAPTLVSPKLSTQPLSASDTKTHYDALAKLVAEGKISQADYLKLAPNKGPSNAADNKLRVLVLQRCNSALNKLHNLHLPSHLMMNNMLGGQADAKYITPQYSSPLKRQAPIEFLFTKANVSATAQQNKHLVDSIIACLPDLQKVITRPKKKTPKNMKDAAVQTTKPFCDVCEIRENTQFHEASTSIDPEHFCSTVHTQVMEQDLINSKAVFAPSGSVGDGAQMSIAHLTPAQLVSQLAARAKTLKQPDYPPPNQYQRNSSNSYDYDGRGGGQQYQNYSNYRY